jgi:hypothetical protein
MAGRQLHRRERDLSPAGPRRAFTLPSRGTAHISAALAAMLEAAVHAALEQLPRGVLARIRRWAVRDVEVTRSCACPGPGELVRMACFRPPVLTFVGPLLVQLPLEVLLPVVWHEAAHAALWCDHLQGRGDWQDEDATDALVRSWGLSLRPLQAWRCRRGD